MPKLVDLSGRVYGRLTVLCRSGSLYGRPAWDCICTCGNNVRKCGNDLKVGNTASCGCLKRDITKLKNYSHGLTETSEYKAWCKMKSRCTNEDDISFKNYGGRGIIVCPQWINSFENFFADMGPKPSIKHSLERMNNNGDYESGNCKWATKVEQIRNRNITERVVVNGKEISIGQLAEDYGIPYQKLYKRIKLLNWDIERACHQHRKQDLA